MSLKNILQKILPHTMSYSSYKTLVSDLLLRGKSTGHTQNTSYLSYSKLSERRMKRWDKTFTLSKEDTIFFKKWSQPINFLVITEGWCGDAAHALPILFKITEVSPNISLQLVLRDDNEELMQLFLTNGSKSIPKLIALNPDYEVLFTWGPRPSEATKLVEDFKNKHGKLTKAFKEDLQKWYNKDKGQNVVKDIQTLLESL